MGVEAPVCLLNQFPVKSLLIRAGFVSDDQQDCRALRVEGKGNPPRTIRGVEPKLLHVGMLRPVQRIGMGTAELRSEVLEQLAQRRKLVCAASGSSANSGSNSGCRSTVHSWM